MTRVEALRCQLNNLPVMYKGSRYFIRTLTLPYLPHQQAKISMDCWWSTEELQTEWVSIDKLERA
jgi:hypothetical protein